MKEPSRTKWSRVHVPPDLYDLLLAVGRGDGYPAERIHVFLYALLKECRPEQVEQAMKLLRLNLADLEEFIIPKE